MLRAESGAALPASARRASPPEPDAALLALLVARDRAAFERLHALYAEFVHAVATRFDPASAADVSQEVFLTLWREIDRYQARARFSTWLFRIVANAALDAARRRRRRPEIALEPPAARRSPTGEPARPELEFAAEAAALEVALDLRAALAELPPRLRLPLVLRFWGGLDYGEIARVLALRPGTVASRLHRALARLAVRLDATATRRAR